MLTVTSLTAGASPYSLETCSSRIDMGRDNLRAWGVGGMVKSAAVIVGLRPVTYG